MASSITLQTLQGTLLRSHFLGQNNLTNRPHKPCSLIPKHPRCKLKTCAKFDLFEILGGRGLLKGEVGIQEELTRNISEDQSPPTTAATTAEDEGSTASETLTAKSGVPEDGFDKELMGLTGGFPGGEKGLEKFIQENPPPPKKQSGSKSVALTITSKSKPKPPELPLLMPGMIAIVKNPNNPFYMYCGIVQRITDGKVGVIFEGGVWDRMVTFELNELEQREKGPPGKNPKSAVIEAFFEKESQ